MNNVRKICYAGIYPPKAPRDAVYLEELKKRGVELLEAVDNSAGFAKYQNIYRQIKKISASADFIWVGYLSPVVVLVARLASGKKIVYNALSSSYESYVLDRAVCGKYSPKAFLFWLADFIAFHLSSVVLVESQAQKKFLSRLFLVSKKKLEVVYTGVNENIFHPDPLVPRRSDFTVIFRGMFIPATGVEYVLETAKILKDENIKFILIGWGQLKDKVVKYIADNNLKNVELITVFLEPDVLRRRILESHIMLGQFSKNPRLQRTIQHKTSEALALSMPYITRDSESNREILSDGIDCVFVDSADSRAIAVAILRLRDNKNLRDSLSTGAIKTYQIVLSPEILANQVGGCLERLLS